jgi:hypothetical protein
MNSPPLPCGARSFSIPGPMIRARSPHRRSVARSPWPLLFASAVSGLSGQGLRWADSSVPPVIYLRQLANGDWLFCCDGWSTRAGLTLGGDDQAAGVGVPYGSRTVRATESEFIRGGAGGEATTSVWFPFVDDPGLFNLFGNVGATTWYTFRATTGPVADRDFGALTFRVPMEMPRRPYDDLQRSLTFVSIGAAAVNGQGQATGSVYVRTTTSQIEPAPICYYKFDRGAGDVAINYAGVVGGARGLANLSRPSGSPWTGGRFGDSALRAGSRCDTGWFGDLGGRFTVSFFMRGNGAPSTASSVFTLGNFTCFTGGPAGTGMRCSGWGGNPLDLTDNIQARAAQGWVHVALVVDESADQAQWYVDGALRSTIALAQQAEVRVPASATALQLGSSGAQTSVYDLDEFRLTSNAASATVIAAWATDSPGVGVAFSAACGANLRHSGTPALGGSFAYRVEAAAGSMVALYLSAVANAPLDLGALAPPLAGCAWYSDTSSPMLVFPVPQAGVATLNIPVPNDQQLRGLELFAQAVAVPANLALSATNAHVISLR